MYVLCRLFILDLMQPNTMYNPCNYIFRKLLGVKKDMVFKIKRVFQQRSLQKMFFNSWVVCPVKLAIFFQKKKFFASSPWKSVTNYVIEWTGLNFDVFPGFQQIPKGQIISECPYEIIVSPKIPPKKFPRFLP